MDKTNKIESLLNEAITLLREEENKPGDVTNSAPLNIISVFRPCDRIEEYIKDNNQLPRTPDGFIDFWQVGVGLCRKDGGHLATCEELAKLADYLYNAYDTPIDGDTDDFGGSECDLDRIKELGLPNPPFWVWSDSKNDSNYSWSRGFGSSYSDGGANARGYQSYWAVCLGD